MDPTWRTDSKLLEPVRRGLIEFCDAMHASLGPRLESIVLYGSLVKGDYLPQRSDVNVVVVLHGVTVETLDLCRGPLTDAARDLRLSAMILTEAELRSSCDVFPVKFLDLQRWHRVLFGKDVLVGTTVRRDHLRLRCEQEVKNLLLKLRRFYVLRAHRPELVQATLEQGVTALLGELAVMLYLRGQDPPGDRREIAEAAGRALQIDRRAILDALELRTGEAHPDAEDLRRRYGAFLAVTARAAEIVDAMA